MKGVNMRYLFAEMCLNLNALVVSIDKRCQVCCRILWHHWALM